MDPRRLTRNGPLVCPLGFGAFKIGRNEQIKYAQVYDLPDERAVQQLLDGLLELGINYIDTAPAYGVSEERIGNALAARRQEFALSTKVGETFTSGVTGGQSSYDFSKEAVERSVRRSLARLKTDTLDAVFIHAGADDLATLTDTDVVPTLVKLRESGVVRAIGLSGKTVPAAEASLEWADCLMVQYHQDDRSHEAVIAQAAQRGIGVIVKKPLASGSLNPAEGLRFVLGNPHVSAAVVGSLNLEHIRANLAALEAPNSR